MQTYEQELDNFFIRLQTEARQRWKDVPVVVLNRRVNFLKVRIVVEKGLFIDVYYNAMNGRLSFALILEGERVFGYDKVKTWHRHPFEDPSQHVPCVEPALEQVFAEIEEVITILIERS
jgi:hypothetical protein